MVERITLSTRPTFVTDPNLEIGENFAISLIFHWIVTENLWGRSYHRPRLENGGYVGRYQLTTEVKLEAMTSFSHLLLRTIAASR